MKIHHLRSSMKTKSPIDGGPAVFEIYYCGKTFYGEIVSQVIDLHTPSPAEMAKMNHCRRCLVGKRKHEGDAYMKELGLPLLRVTRGQHGGRGPIVEDPA